MHVEQVPQGDFHDWTHIGSQEEGQDRMQGSDGAGLEEEEVHCQA